MLGRLNNSAASILDPLQRAIDIAALESTTVAYGIFLLNGCNRLVHDFAELKRTIIIVILLTIRLFHVFALCIHILFVLANILHSNKTYVQEFFKITQSFWQSQTGVSFLFLSFISRFSFAALFLSLNFNDLHFAVNLYFQLLCPFFLTFNFLSAHFNFLKQLQKAIGSFSNATSRSLV